MSLRKVLLLAAVSAVLVPAGSAFSQDGVPPQTGSDTGYKNLKLEVEPGTLQTRDSEFGAQVDYYRTDAASNQQGASVKLNVRKGGYINGKIEHDYEGGVVLQLQGDARIDTGVDKNGKASIRHAEVKVSPFAIQRGRWTTHEGKVALTREYAKLPAHVLDSVKAMREKKQSLSSEVEQLNSSLQYHNCSANRWEPDKLSSACSIPERAKEKAEFEALLAKRQSIRQKIEDEDKKERALTEPLGITIPSNLSWMYAKQPSTTNDLTGGKVSYIHKQDSDLGIRQNVASLELVEWSGHKAMEINEVPIDIWATVMPVALTIGQHRTGESSTPFAYRGTALVGVGLDLGVIGHLKTQFDLAASLSEDYRDYEHEPDTYGSTKSSDNFGNANLQLGLAAGLDHIGRSPVSVSVKVEKEYSYGSRVDASRRTGFAGDDKSISRVLVGAGVVF